LITKNKGGGGIKGVWSVCPDLKTPPGVPPPPHKKNIEGH